MNLTQLETEKITLIEKKQILGGLDLTPRTKELLNKELDAKIEQINKKLKEITDAGQIQSEGS